MNIGNGNNPELVSEILLCLQENTTSMENRCGIGSSFEASSSRRPRSLSSGSPCYASSEGRSSPILPLQESGDSQAGESRSTPPPQPFPISHLLEFDTEARAERHELSACLASEFGASESTALAALEAFGMDTIRARQWLQTPQDAQQVRWELDHALFVLICRQHKIRDRQFSVLVKDCVTHQDVRFERSVESPLVLTFHHPTSRAPAGVYR